MDLAIGMIIGAAFTALVNSVVNNLFMPILSVFTGGIDFSNLYLPLSTGSKDAFMAGADIATARAAGSVLPYGTFITDLIQFLILAFVVFLMVRGLAKMMKSAKEEEVAEAPADDLLFSFLCNEHFPQTRTILAASCAVLAAGDPDCRRYAVDFRAVLPFLADAFAVWRADPTD